MRKRAIISLAVVGVCLLAGYAAYRVVVEKDKGTSAELAMMLKVAAERDEAEREAEGPSTELAKALEGAQVSLATGLSASAREGQPLSGTFALEDETLQLSVYTMRGNAFAEVIVDSSTGQIAKVKPVTSGEELTVAKMQAAAMARAKQSLRAVVDKAVTVNQGFRAVSVTPTLTEGHPVAEVTLVKDDTVKTVTERLDE